MNHFVTNRHGHYFVVKACVHLDPTKLTNCQMFRNELLMLGHVMIEQDLEVDEVINTSLIVTRDKGGRICCTDERSVEHLENSEAIDVEQFISDYEL